MSIRRRGVVCLAIATVVLLAMQFSSVRHERRAPTVAAAVSTSKPRSSVPEDTMPDAEPARDPYLVLAQGSLRGSHPDGSITVGADGRLQPDAELRRLFDYYLGLIGETDLKGIRQLLGDELARRRLSPQVMSEALTDFDKYVKLQQASVEFAEQMPQDPLVRLQGLQKLREQILGADLAQAFYADQRRGEQKLAQRLMLARDKTLSPEEQRKRLAAMAKELSSEQKAEQKRWQAADDVEALNQQLAEAHADADTRYELRAAEWGDEAASRMAELDQQRAEWQQRLADFRQAAQSIDDNSNLSQTEKQAQRIALLQSRFSSAEQGRVRALLGPG